MAALPALLLLHRTQILCNARVNLCNNRININSKDDMKMGGMQDNASSIEYLRFSALAGLPKPDREIEEMIRCNVAALSCS
jgi:hypothetical protein